MLKWFLSSNRHILFCVYSMYPFNCVISIVTFTVLFPQTTFPDFYQSLCLKDSDLWLSFSHSSHSEQEIPLTIRKKISPFQQVSISSIACKLIVFKIHTGKLESTYFLSWTNLFKHKCLLFRYTLIEIFVVFNNCNIFFPLPQLLLIQALRPDRLQSAMVAFATQTLGRLQFKKCVICHVMHGAMINSHLIARMAQCQNLGLFWLRCGFSLGKLWFLLILKDKEIQPQSCNIFLSLCTFCFSVSAFPACEYGHNMYSCNCRREKTLVYWFKHQLKHMCREVLRVDRQE